MSENKLDITSTAAEKGIDAAKGFLGKLIGPAVEEVGQLMADPIRSWRLKNQIKILQKAEKYVKDRGISTKVIAVKTLVPLLEYSSLEDDETLQEKWANLFVNYVDSNKKYKSSIFPNILNQLSSDEVLQLDGFFTERSLRRDEISISDAELANLIRLGLIVHLQPHSQNNWFRFKIRFRDIGYKWDEDFRLTELGLLFYECCSAKGNNEEERK